MVLFGAHDADEALFLCDLVALPADGGPTGIRQVPRTRDRAAHDDPATTALRRDVLDSPGGRTS
ncbi:hypothetical protein [Streptomyces sp. bgisy034]|uniref:hypothetical protein n=1 Tax=Streptomyces sp. bgisy034 TaxID=3413774 RepID=UPI003EB74DD2